MICSTNSTICRAAEEHHAAAAVGWPPRRGRQRIRAGGQDLPGMSQGQGVCCWVANCPIFKTLIRVCIALRKHALHPYLRSKGKSVLFCPASCHPTPVPCTPHYWTQHNTMCTRSHSLALTHLLSCTELNPNQITQLTQFAQLTHSTQLTHSNHTLPTAPRSSVTWACHVDDAHVSTLCASLHPRPVEGVQESHSRRNARL